jgi:hypothetical protein
MLGAMQSASARLQTSNQLFGTAVDNFFREPGNILDEHVVRPLANRLLERSLGFDEALRDLRNIADGDILPDDLDEFEKRLGAAVDVMKQFPGPVGTAAEAAEDAAEFLGNLSISWPGWPDIGAEWPGWPSIDTQWPGWPDIDASWPGWPSINAEWSGWPSINTDWPGWPNVNSEWDDIGWPNVKAGWDGWPDIPEPAVDISGSIDIDLAGTVQDFVEDRLDFEEIVEDIKAEFDIPGIGGGGGGGNGGGGNGGGGNGGGGGGGGDVNPPGRFPGDGGGGGGGGGGGANPPGRFGAASIGVQSTGRRRGGGTAGIEQKLDRLHDDLRRLESALDVTLQVGREEIGRAAADGKRQDISDSNPRV